MVERLLKELPVRDVFRFEIACFVCGAEYGNSVWTIAPSSKRLYATGASLYVRSRS